MKKVIAREELCLNCKLCEVYCRTAHSVSKDVVRAHLKENPVPVSRITVEGDILETPELMLFSRAERTEKLTGGVRV